MYALTHPSVDYQWQLFLFWFRFLILGLNGNDMDKNAISADNISSSFGLADVKSSSSNDWGVKALCYAWVKKVERDKRLKTTFGECS